MKLWQKLTAVCGAVLIGITVACSWVQLYWTQEKILDITRRQAAEKQSALETAFHQMVDYYGKASDPPAARRALLHYCFTRFADSTAVLVTDGETVYSQLSIQPENYLQVTERQSFFSGTVDGRRLLMVGRALRLGSGQQCQVYVTEDITQVYAAIRQMALRFALLGAGAIVAGLGLMALLICRSMRPLGQLQKAAAQISQGLYDRRAKVRTHDEVGDLAQCFNQMAASVERHVEQLLETANRQRLFIGGVTHEFKTPLTAILLNADSLQNTCMTEDEQQQALACIESQGRWLERMVQKLLKLLTLRQDAALKPLPVETLLDRVREATSELLRSRGVGLTVECGMDCITGDMDLLQSALVNLVDNASKASRPGQTVALSARDNRLEVRDWGTGIPAAALAHITEPFYMADKSRSKKLGSIGLGLALVREIALAHGAELEIQSTPGAGTTVALRFP
ncbi:MAG: HAMP domain-containing sensor histidine kinase [Eubacteriales bacterium]|nr:HAMP domain-containing sensor histidine kinase [Eubacteriales bacterium]